VKRLFVINRRSGGGMSARRFAALERFFAERGGGFQAATPATREEAIAVTREAVRAGIEQIVAVGGDGTLNAVANGIVAEDSPRSVRLAIGREGTGSDYYRTVSGGKNGDWRETVMSHTVRAVDLGQITWDAGSIVFLNMGSVGLTAEVIRRMADNPPGLPGWARYALPILRALPGARPRDLNLRLDGVDEELRALALFVGKGRFAGAGLQLGGGVALDDGQLGMTTVRPLRPWQAPLRLLRIRHSMLEGDPLIMRRVAREIAISGDGPLEVECDGELVGSTDALRFTCLPGALNVCFP
jgi:diacylglycerol kinase family enzyme